MPGAWSESGKRGKGSDPLKITAAPRGQSLEVTLENPACSALSGKLVVRADGENSDGSAVQIGKGHDQAHLRLPLQTGIHQVLLADEQGSAVAQTTAARYQPMSGFPAGPELSTELDAILFVDNSPRSPRPLTLTAAGADALAPLALEVPYQFDPGWRYLTVAPR